MQIVSCLSRPLPSAVRLQIFLGRNAHLDIVQATAGEGIAADYIDAILDEGAHLRIAEQLRPSKGSYWRFLRAFLQQNAYLSVFSRSQGINALQRDWQVVLNGNGAEVNLKGLDDLIEDGQVHTKVLVQHSAPSCRSRQHFKKILQGKSRSSCEGKIHIESAAHGSDAKQLCQNLLLSNAASATMKPFLNIFADDVAVHHGATLSQPDDEELFYFRSRGIGEREAKELWRQGFCRELIDSIEIPLMRAKL